MTQVIFPLWTGAGDPREPGVSKAAQQPPVCRQPDGRFAGRRFGNTHAQHVAPRPCAASSVHAVRTCCDEGVQGPLQVESPSQKAPCGAGTVRLVCSYVHQQTCRSYTKLSPRNPSKQHHCSWCIIGRCPGTLDPICASVDHNFASWYCRDSDKFRNGHSSTGADDPQFGGRLDVQGLAAKPVLATPHRAPPQMPYVQDASAG